MRKRTDGFTLVELMVVVLVVGILVAVAVPVFKSAKSQAEANACKANQRMIYGAIEAATASGKSGGGGNIGGPVAVSAWTAVLIPDYLKAIPLCPTKPENSVRRNEYAYEYFAGKWQIVYDWYQWDQVNLRWDYTGGQCQGFRTGHSLF